MEMYKIADYIARKNPTPAKRDTLHILTEKMAGEFRGISAILPPGTRVDYHYHNHRESLLIAISGEAIEVIDGKKVPFKVNDIMYMPTGQKHGMINDSKKEFRYLEFMNGAGADDFVTIDWPAGF
jgi:mannose-6-phosphate isomerase-like protein (cupin superfamily)